MKNIIVTGASGNLGQAVIQQFLLEGWQVTGTVRSQKTEADNSDDHSFKKVAVDLNNETATGEFVTTIIAEQGKLDAAVLTVGGFAMGSIAETTAKDIFIQYQLNFDTAYAIARPVFIQMMKQGSGRIFLVGSQAGMNMEKSKGVVAYGLAKSLIFRLAELMNDEAYGTDVKTIVVVPSTIDTPQNRRSMPHADFTKWVKPETIAGHIFLNCISDDPSLLIED